MSWMGSLTAALSQDGHTRAAPSSPSVITLGQILTIYRWNDGEDALMRFLPVSPFCTSITLALIPLVHVINLEWGR